VRAPRAAGHRGRGSRTRGCHGGRSRSSRALLSVHRPPGHSIRNVAALGAALLQLPVILTLCASDPLAYVEALLGFYQRMHRSYNGGTLADAFKGALKHAEAVTKTMREHGGAGVEQPPLLPITLAAAVVLPAAQSLLDCAKLSTTQTMERAAGLDGARLHYVVACDTVVYGPVSTSAVGTRFCSTCVLAAACLTHEQASATFC